MVSQYILHESTKVWKKLTPGECLKAKSIPGYTKSLIEKLVQKIKTKKLIKDTFALLADKEENEKNKNGLLFKTNQQNQKVFRKHDIQRPPPTITKLKTY